MTIQQVRRYAALLVVLALLLAAPVAAAVGEPTATRVTLPPVAPFDYQLGGAYPPPVGVRVVTRDRTARPAPGLYSICYVNAFQTQDTEIGWWRRRHPALLLHDGGREVRDPGWPEVLLDTSTAAKRRAIAAIVGRWIDGCAAHGFRAVEPDNLDSWTRSHRLLTAADNLALAGLFVGRAHRDGLAIAQKNSADQSRRGHRAGFDFAVAEECAVYAECGAYTAVYGRHVLEIEYTDNGAAAFRRACAGAGGRPVILRDRDLLPAGRRGHVYRRC